MAESLIFPPQQAAKLKPHLPPLPQAQRHPEISPSGVLASSKPFVTLTFATSLDSALSLAPGVRTALSGPASKAMTHFLRSRHDAISVGVGTAIADDPGLNCRLALDLWSSVPLPASGEVQSEQRRQHQPRPVVIDPRARWAVSEESKIIRLVGDGMGLAPFVITALSVDEVPAAQREVLERFGGKYIHLSPTTEGEGFEWEDILAAVKQEGLESIMIEGGGHIINSLLEGRNLHLVDSVIITIAPVWLGQGGVLVSPKRAHDDSGNPTAAARLTGCSWHQLGEDVVLCGKFLR